MKLISRILLPAALLATGFSATAETRYRYSTAFSGDTNEVIYTEEHIEQYDNNSILESRVIYRDRNGIIFAEKTVDYSNNPHLPGFRLDNQLAGHQEIGTHKDGYYEVYYRNESRNIEQQAKLEPARAAVADAGFDQFIIDHWQDITAGSTLRAAFLIPSMQTFIDFRIYEDKTASTLSSGSRHMIVEPDSVLYRIFADSIRLEYRYDEPVLKVFTGVSNLRDDTGENFKVTIVFGQRDNLLGDRSTP